MAREPTITQEQVNAVADGLRAKGSKPTARAVREQLGTGSMATVLKLFQVWKSNQVQPAEAPITLPVGFQRVLVDFVSQEIAAAKAELQEELANLQQANTDLIGECERSSASIRTLTEELDTSQTEKAALAGRLQQLERDLAQARQEATEHRQAAEAARTELAKTQLRLEAMPRLEEDLNRIRIEAGQERAARVASEQMAAVLTAKLEAETTARQSADAEIIELTRKTDDATTRALTTSDALGAARVAVEKVQARVEALTRELETAKAEAKNAAAEAKKAGEIAAELRGQLDALKGSKTG